MAVTHAGKELFAWKRLFKELQFDSGHDISILCDNQQTVGLLDKDDSFSASKLRHIDINTHRFRQEVQAYAQESGRTGRDGLRSESIIFVPRPVVRPIPRVFWPRRACRAC